MAEAVSWEGGTENAHEIPAGPEWLLTVETSWFAVELDRMKSPAMPELDLILRGKPVRSSWQAGKLASAQAVLLSIAS